MEARQVDPRDTKWEHDADRFRVHFWTTPDGSDPCRSDEWEVDATDVREVIAWAEGQRPSRGDYVLYAVLPFTDVDGWGLGLVQLAGTDPTSG